MIILKYRLTQLEEAIAKANRKAAKHGLNPITLNVISEFDERREQFVKIDIGEYKTEMVQVRVCEVEVIGDLPYISGWKLVGNVQKLDGEMNLIHGHDLKRDYRTSKLYCEHCAKHTPRKIAYIIENEQGEQKMVGASCVQDFFHTSPEAHFSYMNALMVIDETFDPEKEDREFRMEEQFWSVKEAIAYALKSIREFGFHPSSDDCPTRNDIYNFKQGYDKQDMEEAELVVEYWKSTEDQGDFAQNCKALAVSGGCRWRNFGVVAAMAWSWFKVTKLEPKEKVEKSNEWLGKIGDRLTFEVKLVTESWSEGYYGTTWIYGMEDAAGSRLTWFASSPLDKEIGESFKIKGTIKEHDEYKGRKQTVITRCKVAS